MIGTKQMPDKIFFDSNALVYAFSTDEPLKKHIIDRIIVSDYDIILSTQVINEFINVMHRKRKFPFDELAVTVQEIEDNFSIVQVTMETIQQALKISHRYKFSYFDSLMISSALEQECSVLCSEDMHNQQVIEGRLIIQNPFASKI